jgi:predicted RND superfamily exporter protein
MNSGSPDNPPLGPRRRALRALERVSRQHYRIVFLVALLAALGGGWLGSRLEIESDILDLVPRGNTRIDDFKRAAAEFGSIAHLVIVLEAGPDEGADELEDFADLLGARLEELPELITDVEYSLDPGADLLSLFYDHAMLYLPPDRLDELAAKLSDEAIREQVEQNRLSLASPTAAFTEELMVNDPLGLLPLFLERPLGNLGDLDVDLSDGYYLSRDGRTLLMLVEPAGPWQDLAFDQRLMDGVRQAAAEARGELEREQREAGLSPPGIVTSYTGRYAIAVDEAALIRQDVQRNLLLSLAAVSALYFICYRRFAALLYSSVPLLVGQAVTFGLAFFVLGRLNASSSAFTALLMGLGTDFVIVMYVRYVEERQKGRTLGESTELMVGETGLGVFTGAITSAGTFYAMCISEFRGLRDLGFLIGSGILLCALAIVFLVPAMIKWNEGVRRRKVDAIRKLHVQSFLLEHLISFSARHRLPVLVALGVAAAAGAWLAVRIEFDDTVSVLRSTKAPAYAVQQRLTEEFGMSLSYMMAIGRADTDREALELAETIERRLAPWIADGTLSSRDSILGYIPPRARQEQVLALLAAGGDRFDLDRIRATFLSALDANGFRREGFEVFLGRLERMLSPRGPMELGDLDQRGLGRLIERYVRRDAEGVRVVTYLSLSDPRWKREAPPGLIEAVVAGDPDIVLTGTNVVSRELRRIFTRESRQAVLLGLGVVTLLLLVDFRSFKLTLIALAQLVTGVVLMLGVMKVLDIHLNYVNAFVATMILGVGIDYGIHVAHRLSLSGGRVEAGLLETGKAVVIAALTNIAAFGTLVFANYPALRSFGMVAAIGSATCLLTSLTLVPALMARSSERDAGPP